MAEEQAITAIICTHQNGSFDAFVMDDAIEVCRDCGLPGRWSDVECSLGEDCDDTLCEHENGSYDQPNPTESETT